MSGDEYGPTQDVGTGKPLCLDPACGLPLDPVLLELGDIVHPDCRAPAAWAEDSIGAEAGQ
jgi:hypothetical protein